VKRLLVLAAIFALSACTTQNMAKLANPNGIANGGDSGLPCEVQSFLETNCWQCHGAMPTGGAPMPLMTLADLQAPAMTVPAESTGQLSVARMSDAQSPMPPGGILDPTVRATLENWVAGGMQAGSCQLPGTDPYGTPSVCTSGQTDSSRRESSTMLPGEACISCHQTNDGPRFAIAGTVYPTAHEPDDCVGASSGIQVVITDANNQVTTLTTNQAGNFYSRTRLGLALPYHAKVVSAGKERAMSAAQTSGDCNSCHTEQGANQAPGRVMAP
jgi:hypothetical protein